MAPKSARARRAWLKRVARRTLAASSAALLPVVAHAEGNAFGGGAFIGYNFGDGSPVEWGFEAYGTRVLNEEEHFWCGSEPAAYGVGGFVRASWVGLDDVRLTLGGHAGGELGDEALFALTGELGASYRFGRHSGFGIHTGAIAETSLLNAAARTNGFATMPGSAVAFASWAPTGAT